MGRGRSTTAEYTPVSQPVGIYGWRKRCLYAFILFLMVVMIMNLALTVWILRVMDFSIDGMGQLRITDRGVKVSGEAEFIKTLYAQDIKSREGDPLFIVSSQDLHMQAQNKENKPTSTLHLEENQLTAECDSFEVKDLDGQRRFYVDKDEVIMGTDEVVYSGNAKFDGSVETPVLSGPRSESLVVESASSAVKMSGLGGVSLHAPAGNVALNTAEDIRLHSKHGAIYLDSSNIFLKDLAVSEPGTGRQSKSGVFQLCICQTGRVFLSAPSGDCRATEDICKSS